MTRVEHIGHKWSIYLAWDIKPAFMGRSWLIYHPRYDGWWPDRYRMKGAIALCDSRLERLPRERFLALANGVVSSMLVEAARLASRGNGEEADSLLAEYNEMLEWLENYDGE